MLYVDKRTNTDLYLTYLIKINLSNMVFKVLKGKHYSSNKYFIHHLLALERAHISSNSNFIELDNVEFEHMSSSKKMNFSNLSLTLQTSLPSFLLGYSKYFKFYQVWVSTKYKPSNLNFVKFELWVRKLIEFSSFE